MVDKNDPQTDVIPEAKDVVVHLMRGLVVVGVSEDRGVFFGQEEEDVATYLLLADPHGNPQEIFKVPTSLNGAECVIGFMKTGEFRPLEDEDAGESGS